jgi:hypothetical protein
MALQALDADDVDYQNYARAAAGPGQRPALNREAYVLTSAGRTAVRTAGVTGIYSQQNMAEVPRDLVDGIEFSSAFGTAMVGTYGDLVAMQVMPLLGPWLTHVLCRKREPDYAGYLEHYATGVFQSSDGREIDGRLRVVEGGERIDLATFRRVPPQAHSAAQAAGRAMRFRVQITEFIPIASSDSFIDGYGVVYSHTILSVIEPAEQHGRRIIVEHTALPEEGSLWRAVGEKALIDLPDAVLKFPGMMIPVSEALLVNEPR